ncbi:MAG: molybdate ABC transporter substrate-binding protein, partial [Firmicutes bacterium]|nr:molybdate ABC transporter substrate-binding protein [Bacillota bacterium]
MLSFHLRKRLREFELDISLEVEAHTLVLIGHSGCGKTTTLQILAGLLAPDEGRIALDDEVFLDTSRKLFLAPEKRDVGIVFQDYALFPHLSVGDHVAYGLRHLKRDEVSVRVQEILHLFGIEALAQAMPESLSGGQQQRVALARALAPKPRLLLLDEPLSALDVSTRGHVRSELRGLLDLIDIPCVVVTHDYEDARVLGHEIVVMDRGHVVQRGTATDIGLYPVNRFVAQFAGTNYALDPITGDPEHGSGVTVLSFDPWHAILATSAPAKPLVWRGHVTDVASFGRAMRVWIGGATPLLVDVEAGDWPARGYQIGDAVYVAIDGQHVRRYGISRDSGAVWPDLNQIGGPALVASVLTSSTVGVDRLHAASESGGAKHSATAWRPPSRLRFMRSPVTSAVVLILAVGIFSWLPFLVRAHADDTQNGQTLIAFVAANATDPFNSVIRSFDQSHPGVDVQASYTGTQILQTQLQQGAPDDLFLSADRSHIVAIQREGLVSDFFPVSRDDEVIVVPKSNPAHITSLEDLATEPVSLIIGVTSVPIGKYTREIFQRADRVYGPEFATTALRHVVSEEVNVKQILEKVALGDAEAGVVYQTDVTPNVRSEVNVIRIPVSLNVVATNYIAVPIHAPHQKLAHELLAMMLSPSGQAIFRRFGYQP